MRAPRTARPRPGPGDERAADGRRDELAQRRRGRRLRLEGEPGPEGAGGELGADEAAHEEQCEEAVERTRRTGRARAVIGVGEREDEPELLHRGRLELLIWSQPKSIDWSPPVRARPGLAACGTRRSSSGDRPPAAARRCCIGDHGLVVVEPLGDRLGTSSRCRRCRRSRPMNATTRDEDRLGQPAPPETAQLDADEPDERRAPGAASREVACESGVMRRAGSCRTSRREAAGVPVGLRAEPLVGGERRGRRTRGPARIGVSSLT